MLVPHEPTLDPRVDYTARSLAADHNVTVLATVRSFERRPLDNYVAAPPYRTVRLDFKHQFGIRMLRDLIEFRIVGRVSGHNRLARFASAAVIVLAGIGAVSLFFVEVAFAVLRALVFLSRRRYVGLTLKPELIRGVSSPFLPLCGLLLRTLSTRKREAARILDELIRGSQMVASVFRFAFEANGQMIEYVKDHKIIPDIVYCHDLYALQAGVKLRRMYGSKVIYDSHEYYPYAYDIWPYVKFTKWYEAGLVRMVDVYLTVSPQLRHELETIYSVRRIDVIPNVEPLPAVAIKVLETGLLQRAKGRLKVLYQGSFAEGRGLEEILTEWKSVDGTKAALFLRGPDNYVLHRLAQKAAELDLLDVSVYILSPVLEKDLVSAAAEADVGVIPYKADSLAYRFACPNKLCQYLHAGAAILTNRISFVEDLVVANELGLCYDVRDPGSFAAAVTCLSNDFQRLERLKSNARRFAECEYNWGMYDARLRRLVSGALDIEHVSVPQALRVPVA